MNENPLIVFLAVIAAGVLLYWLRSSLAGRRANKLRELAGAIGLDFLEEGGVALRMLEDTGLRVFSEGHSKEVRNVMRRSGFPGGSLFFLDYHYGYGHGRNRTAYSYTLAFFISEEERFPAFELMPENFIDRLEEVLGAKDIDFAGFPVFSDNYQLSGKDEDGLRALFNTDALAWLEQNQGLRVQARGRYLAACLKRGKLAADDCRDFIARSEHLVSLLNKRG